MQVILVRHGRPDLVENADGVADPGLTDLGHWQAGRVKDWLACEDIDAVIASPKRRAQETVAGIARARQLDLTIVDGLDEVDRLARSYYPTELLTTEGGAYWQAVLDGRYEEIGWDPPDVFAARVTEAWNAIVEQRPGDTIVIGAHGGTIKVILGLMSGGSAMGGPFLIDYASISRVEILEERNRVISANETAHFDAQRVARVGPMRGTHVGPTVG